MYYDEDSYWWESEYYHRKALKYFNFNLNKIQPLIEGYEEEMFSAIEDSRIDVNQNMINGYFKKARDIVKAYDNDFNTYNTEPSGWLYRHYWRRYNKINRIY